ncbi:MAG: ABC transporter permease subunit [Ignavibacteriales bacterium]|nr:ABC transporter permease subunit [Ignavibacteriales bacterium]
MIFAIVMPILFSLIHQFVPVEDVQRELGDMETLLKNLPPSIQATFEGLKLEQMFVLYMTAFMLAPLFLIMPLMFSSVVGADSFVGERERKTMEALLYSPATDMELFLGKVSGGGDPGDFAFVADLSRIHHRGQCCKLWIVPAYLVPVAHLVASDVLAHARLCPARHLCDRSCFLTSQDFHGSVSTQRGRWWCWCWRWWSDKPRVCFISAWERSCLLEH